MSPTSFGRTGTNKDFYSTFWPGLFLLLLLAGCTTPSERIARWAADQGLQAGWIRGDGFVHRTFVNGTPLGKSALLHVYIEGDGLPWETPTRVSGDPTPRDPLALRLMRHDPGPSLYLGRPCYFDPPPGPLPCQARWWTDRRYAPEVLESMRQALEKILRHRGTQTVVLIGYSGGATLATLLAPRLGTRVTGLVTLAGNLDVGAWTRWHRYSPLAGSLDPITQPALPAHIHQWHLLGTEDQVIPPGGVERFVRRQPQTCFLTIAGYNHRCCWEQAWPGILKFIQPPEDTR